MLVLLRAEFICLVALLFLACYYFNTKLKNENHAFTRLINWSICYVLFDAITLTTVNTQEQFGGAINDIAHYIFYFLGASLGFAFFLYCIQLVCAHSQIKFYRRLGHIPLIL